MPIPSQIVDLPLVGGLAQSDDAVLTLHPTRMRNCLYRKTGSVAKRYGMRAVGDKNVYAGLGRTPPTGELLATFGDELLRVGGGDLATFQSLPAYGSDWIYKDRVSRCAIQKTPIATNAASLIYVDPDCVYCNGFLVVVYLSTNLTASQTEVCCDIVNVATSAYVLSRFVVGNGSGIAAPKVASLGTTVGVFYYDVGGAQILGRFLDMTTLVFANLAIVGSTLAGPYFDVSPLDATHWVFAAEGAAAAGLGVWAISTAITGGTNFTLTAGTTFYAAETGLTAVGVQAVAGERVWLTWGKYAAGAYTARVATLTTGLATQAGPLTLGTAVSTPGVRCTVVARLTSTTAVCAFDVLGETLFWNEVSVSGAVITATYGTLKQVMRQALLSRPLLQDGRAFVLSVNNHGTHGTHFLIDLHLGETLTTSQSPHIEAVALPRLLAATRPAGIPTTRGYGAASWAATATSGEYYVATLTSADVDQSYTLAVLKVSFGTLWRKSAVETVNTCTLTGGCVQGYDRTETYELGFAYEPDVQDLPALTESGGGSLKQSKRYAYIFVFAWADAQGNAHRSAPSAAVSITTSASGSDDRKIAVYVPQLHLTNKAESTDPRYVPVVEVYRTEGDGSVYYLCQTLRNVPGTIYQSFNDTMSDAALAVLPALYSTGASGTTKVNHIPPSATFAFVWKSAVLLAGTEDDSIWFSKEVLEGDGVAFNESLVIAPFEGGRVTGLATLDGAALVIFKSESIWYVQGEPPNDLGVSTLTAPTRIQTDVGCVDPASILSTPNGLVFAGRGGLYLLDRALAVTPIGKGVEASYVPYAGAQRWAGAALLPSQQLARFVQYGTATASALNLDYFHSGQGGPVWSTDDYQDPAYAAAEPGLPVACCVWRGVFTWLSTRGFTYQEDPTIAYDTGVANVAWVPMTFTTSLEKVTGPQGFHRVRRCSALLGQTSRHALSVTLTSDLGTETRTWTAAEIDALPGLPTEQVQVHSQYQKVQRMSVTLEDADPVTSRGDGSGATLRALSLEVAMKPALGRTSAAQSK